METFHKILFGDARKLINIPDESVDLVVTSPPYPMIEMWDELFSSLNPEISEALRQSNGWKAFYLMHEELMKTWVEIFRVLRKGGIACINIGDATRKTGSNFQLFPNHSVIIQKMIEIGFQPLPLIIWRKPTNSPNKFMGSGMLPPNAYVTLEHEYILIFRKKGIREFKSEEERRRRYESAYFWEERNKWFSDMWIDIGGVPQTLDGEGVRDRSAAFPFDLAYRLISMFSIYQDTVLDPFLGTGTTMLASMVAGRNSIGIEIEKKMRSIIEKKLGSAVYISEIIINDRIKKHRDFVSQRKKEKRIFRHNCFSLDMPVMTKQETGMLFYKIKEIEKKEDKDAWKYVCAYDKITEE